MNASSGDLNPRHFRGVVLSVIAMSWMSASVTSSRSVLRGSQRLIRPLAFSMPPFCHEA